MRASKRCTFAAMLPYVLALFFNAAVRLDSTLTVFLMA